MGRFKTVVPLVVVLLVLFLLGYPIAFLLAYPQAKNRFEDPTQWTQRTIYALPPVMLASSQLQFGSEADLQNGLLIHDDTPVKFGYQVEDDGIRISKSLSIIPLVVPTPNEGLKDGQNRVFHVSTAAPNRPVYLDGKLLKNSYEAPPEKPDSQRTVFTFSDSSGVFIFRGEWLQLSKDYTLNGDSLVLHEPPPLWLELRSEPDWARPLRITGDYAWANDETLVFREPPPAHSELLLAESLIFWAERLQGSNDGVNRLFSFRHGKIVVNDPLRQIYVNDQLLSEDAYQVVDFARGTILLKDAPKRESRVWTSQYAIYDRPLCGATIWDCVLSLPQQPMPLPHQIIERVPAFLTRYDFQSERNVWRQIFYTMEGTLVSLLLGTFFGALFAILFVFYLPLERAFLPWVIASQTVPIIALVPVLILVLANLGIPIQTSRWPTALIGGYLSFFPITIGLTKGLRSVDPLKLDLMQSYAATRAQELLKLRLFAALPYLFPSLKIGATVSLLGALISETETSNAKGLGFAIIGQVQAGNVADLWVLFLITAAMGIIIVSLLGWLEKLVAPWVRNL